MSFTPRARNQSHTPRDEALRRRRAGRDARPSRRRRASVSSICVSSSIRYASTPASARDVDESIRVRASSREPIDEQQVDLVEHLLDRPLAVRGRVTDVFALRSMDVREAALQHLDDLGRLVDRQRRLRDVARAACRSGSVERFGVLDRSRRARSRRAPRPSCRRPLRGRRGRSARCVYPSAA